MRLQTISNLAIAFLVGVAMTSVVAVILTERHSDQVRLLERERDLEAIFKAFEACDNDRTCESKFDEAYFALRMDQQLRDGRDALERIYEARPYLRPAESSQ